MTGEDRSGAYNKGDAQMAHQIRRGFADTSTGQVHYRTRGEGGDLVLLHMTNLSSRAFRNVMPLLDGFRCWAPDFPGFGQSDALPGQPDMEAFAGSVIEFMDQVGISKAHVFGLHAGNKVGATMAALWPDRVGKLVLSGLTHSLITDQSRRMAAVPDFGRKQKETRKSSPDERNINDWALLFGKLNRIWWRPSVAGNPNAGAAEINLLEDEILDLLEGRLGFGAFYRASWAFDVGELLARVTVPALVIELATRREAHLGLQGPVIEKLMPDCRSVVEEMHDYDLLYGRPQVLAGHLARFLA